MPRETREDLENPMAEKSKFANSHPEIKNRSKYISGVSWFRRHPKNSWSTHINPWLQFFKYSIQIFTWVYLHKIIKIFDFIFSFLPIYFLRFMIFVHFSYSEIKSTVLKVQWHVWYDWKAAFVTELVLFTESSYLY